MSKKNNEPNTKSVNLRPITNKQRDQAFSQIRAYKNAGHIDDQTVREFITIIKNAEVYDDLDTAFSNLQDDIVQRDPADLTGYLHYPISKKRRILKYCTIISLVLFLGLAPMTEYSFLSFGILLVATVLLYGIKLPYYYGNSINKK